jgi:hypothetical protein
VDVHIDYLKRIVNIQEEMASRGIDLLLATRGKSVTYIGGAFIPWRSVALVSKDGYVGLNILPAFGHGIGIIGHEWYPAILDNDEFGVSSEIRAGRLAEAEALIHQRCGTSMFRTCRPGEKTVTPERRSPSKSEREPRTARALVKDRDPSKSPD